MTLIAKGIRKSFAGLVALNDVDIDVADNECVGLIGPNGAGKTTMFNCILGVLKPDRGTVSFGGATLDGIPIHRRSQLGIARTFQRMELFATMTPREHLLVTARARATHGGVIRDLLGLGKPTAAERSRADEVLELVGLTEQADTAVEALSLGQGRLVELGRAIMTDPKIILLDEPSSGLDRAETRRFAEVLHELRRSRGIAMLIVEHDLELVLDVTTRLFVLDFGQLIASGEPSEVMSHPEVRRAYLGASA